MFYYWIPGREPATFSKLKEIGLGYAFEDGEITKRQNSKGPDGDLGSVVCRNASPWSDKAGYYPDRDDWRKIPKLDGIWVGAPKNFELSSPADIARPKLLDSRQVQLEDGRFWAIPIARRWEEFDASAIFWPNVPCKARYTDEGEWVRGDVKDRYSRLWELVTGYQEAIDKAFEEAEEDTTSVQFDFPVHELAIESVKANYYVSHIEAELLGIYSEEVQAKIVDVAIDREGLEAISKKKQPIDSSSS